MKLPAFIETKKFFSKKEIGPEIEQLTLIVENLKIIHQLTTKNYTDLKTLIREYLLVGIDLFEMQIGIVSEIYGKDYIVKDAVSPDNSIHEGDVFELKDTYCFEVCKHEKVIGLPHIGKLDDMRDHPVYVNMKLEAYLSAPIYKNGKLFGTLNFTSTIPREVGFSEHERDLIAMMANSIGSFLLLQEKEDNLIKMNNRLKKLSGYLAHDLRNPLGNILNITEIINDLNDDERDEMLKLIAENSQKALDIVHSILEASVIGEGKIKLNVQNVHFDQVIREAIESYRTKFYEAELRIHDSVDAVEVKMDEKRIRQVIDNILSNAIKYAKKDSALEINLKEDGKFVSFLMKNEINSKVIKRADGDVSESSSIGFGLEIISEILKLHNSQLHIESKNGFFTVSFKIHK